MSGFFTSIQPRGIQMIEVNEFVSAMNTHWTESLNNVSSANLKKAWGQIASAFNSHIESHNDPKSLSKWTVLSPPTGSGKSQGTAVYCSLLSKLPCEKHIGVLIVTRLKVDADAMANTINTLTGKPSAKAFHTDAKEVSISDLWKWDVLVITHKAYELALDKLGSHGQIQQTWGFFHNYSPNQNDVLNKVTRKLVVIDESLDIVEESQGNLEGLSHTLGCLPHSLIEKHKYAVNGIKALIAILEEMAASSEHYSTKEAVLLREMVKASKPPDYTELRKDLREVRFDLQQHKSDLAENSRLLKIHDFRLKQLDVIFRSWSYYAKSGVDGHTLNTARLLVPEDSKGAVVLDATAIHDVIYELFDKVEVIQPPKGVRDYSNVNLWISRGHKQGKVHMRNNAKTLCESLMCNLSDKLTNQAKVFVCCHQAVEPALKLHKPDFQLNVGHWGAVDGSNQWKDCDTAVIFGLPYIPDTWAANAYFALQGVQDTEWLQTKHRPHGKHKDVREALKTGHIVSSVVQAINRIRCRKVIDVQGNCPKADVYLMLPNAKASEAILKGILESMPKVNLCEWTFSDAKRKTRKSNGEDSLIAYATNMYTGKESSSVIKRSIGIDGNAWERLIAKLKQTGSNLNNELTNIGVTYTTERTGSVLRGYLIKS